MDHGEQVFAGKTLLHTCLIRSHGDWIGVLDEHGLNGGTTLQICNITQQDGPHARLIQYTHTGFCCILALNEGFVEFENAAVGMQSSAAFMEPCPCYSWNAIHSMHVCGTVSRPRKTITQAEIGSRIVINQFSEFNDIGGRNATNRLGPCRSLITEMGF